MTAAWAVMPSDEGRHAPDPDDLWNESYYCDFVNAGGALGGWLRLGLYPNRQVAWWTAWIVRPGLPGIASVDYHAPVPPGDGLVTTLTHLHEPKAARAAGLAVAHDLGAGHGPVLRERLTEVVRRGAEGQVADVQILAHCDPLRASWPR